MPSDLKGLDEMKRRLSAIPRDISKRLARAVKLEAEYIMTVSKREYVPVDLGTLRASGKVDAPVIDNGYITVGMHFGDAASAYALTIHEHPSPHDPPSWNGVTVRFKPGDRGPKYLEIPLKAAIPGMNVRIAKAIDLDTGPGGK